MKEAKERKQLNGEKTEWRETKRRTSQCIVREREREHELSIHPDIARITSMWNIINQHHIQIHTQRETHMHSYIHIHHTYTQHAYTPKKVISSYLGWLN